MSKLNVKVSQVIGNLMIFCCDIKWLMPMVADCVWLVYCTHLFICFLYLYWMTSNKNTRLPVPANVNEFNQYFARQEKILASRENALTNKEKVFAEKKSRISKMSSKVSHSRCWMVLLYIVWLSEVTRLMMLNKLDFYSSLNVHHLKLKNTGYFCVC